MRNKSAYLLLTLLVVFIVSCEKMNLQKDGYYILKTDESRTTYTKCVATVEEFDSKRRTTITAFDLKGDLINLTHDQDIRIVFPDNKEGRWTEFDHSSMFGLSVSIVYNNKLHLFPCIKNNTGMSSYFFSTQASIDSVFNVKALEQISEIDLNIEEYDNGKGTIKGSLSGKFWNNKETDFIVVENSKFVAMIREY